MGINYKGADSLAAASYANNLTVYSPSGGWIGNVNAANVSFYPLSGLSDCGNSRTANTEVAVKFTDAASVVIPANGGYVECNSASNSLATWHRQNWGSFDRTLDYSRIADAGSNSPGRSNLQQFTLYEDNQLICEYVSATGQDPSTGNEPCGISGCTSGGTRTYAARSIDPKTPMPGNMAANRVIAFPNPAKDYVAIAFKLDAAMYVRAEVFDITGQLVRRLDMGERPQGDGRGSLDISNLASGIYLLTLETGYGDAYHLQAQTKFAVIK